MLWSAQVEDEKNDSRSKAYDFSFCVQLKAINDINGFKLWVEGSRWNEQLKVMDDINDFKSWDQDSRCYR